MSDTTKYPAHRQEFTGDASRDRVQENVRALFAFVRDRATALVAAVARIAALETAHGVGILRIPLADANAKLTAAQMAALQWVFTGALSAPRTLTIDDATDVKAYARWATNLTTGGFALTLATSAGSYALANGATKALIVSASGPAAVT